MRWLRFLLKFSFICNCCYLLGFIIRMTDYQNAATKHILVLGYIVAAPINIITCLTMITLLLLRKIQWKENHPYIFILNVIILILQLFT